ncbi:short-chain dehydrogenase reductase SDR [Mytilinidion resinicola]|uniref:Short-chain dehydrogenase reductase SDR n=1 Tax=Mytilinidion resinicola TaxID=574789 RepID=A0A6A6Z423_9PEZI|nr:short-chain dehydrogenase reductase SDR [Mytilinidion resinicola]KAF2815836.1 short-chain dehydrogenase reductase SDR [Mytilinidion resinicola]
MPRTIFITGASSGIGAAVSRLFFEKGWNVAATMRKPGEASELKQLDASRLLLERLDVVDASSIQPAIDAAIAKFGKIDVLFNNAGYAQYGIFEMTSPTKCRDQFDVNLFGVMDVTRAILPHFRASGHGGIVNMGSGAGLWGSPLGTMYTASKFALEGFTEALSYELAPLNIFVKSIVPTVGVGGTKLVESSVAHIAMDEALVPTYGAYMQEMVPKLQAMGSSGALEVTELAHIVYIAATDGTNKVRYVCGADDFGFLKARVESKSDEEYMARMRAWFN